MARAHACITKQPSRHLAVRSTDGLGLLDDLWLFLARVNCWLARILRTAAASSKRPRTCPSIPPQPGLSAWPTFSLAAAGRTARLSTCPELLADLLRFGGPSFASAAFALLTAPLSHPTRRASCSWRAGCKAHERSALHARLALSFAHSFSASICLAFTFASTSPTFEVSGRQMARAHA